MKPKHPIWAYVASHLQTEDYVIVSGNYLSDESSLQNQGKLPQEKMSEADVASKIAESLESSFEMDWVNDKVKFFKKDNCRV